jgi:hypothetical protein
MQSINRHIFRDVININNAQERLNTNRKPKKLSQTNMTASSPPSLDTLIESFPTTSLPVVQGKPNYLQQATILQALKSSGLHLSPAMPVVA